MITKSREEQIAAALNIDAADYICWLDNDMAEDRIRERVRELCKDKGWIVSYVCGWHTAKKQFWHNLRVGSLHTVEDDKGFKVICVKEDSTLMDYHDTEADAWEEALLWLAKRKENDLS